MHHGVEAGAARVGFQCRGSEDGVEDDGSVGQDRANFAAGADAIAKRHQDVEND